MIPPLPIIRLFLSGALQRLLKGLSSAARWLLADWRNGAIAALALFGAWHHFVIDPRMHALLEQSEKLTADTQTAFVDTIVGFTAASAKATADAEANAARVRREQERITDATLADLRSDHAALRLRFDRLRARAAAGDPGRADPARLPAAGSAPGRAAGAPGDQDLRAARELSAQPLCPAALVCLTIDEAEQASRDARNHDRLIDWVIAQSAVTFAPGKERGE